MRKSCNGIGRSGIAHGRGGGSECLDYSRSVCARVVCGNQSRRADDVYSSD